MKEFQMTLSACPACGHQLDTASNLEGPDAPGEGDVTLCIACGALLCFKSDGGVRRATEADINCLDYRQKHLVLALRDFIKERGPI